MRMPILRLLLGLVTASAAGLAAINAPWAQGLAEGGGPYPDPSYPEIDNPKTVEEVMPYARELARNKSTFLGRGFGEVNAGEKIVIVTTTTEPEAEIYIDAILAALKERQVTTILMHDYEIAGVTLEDARALSEYMDANVNWTSEHGWTEACSFLFNNSREFLEQTRPDLYKLCFPAEATSRLPPELRVVREKLASSNIPGYINAYMDKHPDIKGVFYGRGGPTWMQFHPHETRWMSNFTFDNRWNVAAPSSDFPADVWLKSEELTMAPLASTDKVTITDPEGTNVWWELSELQAQRWAQGAYLRGHLFLFPQEAYGQYGLSFINYPSLDPEYIPVEPAVMLNGTVAAHMSHAGFFPRIEQVWVDGYLREVRGGGIYGELLRTLMKVPGIHKLTYPQREKPGYFYHFETAMGTNPKILREDLEKSWGTAGERARDGVLHYGLGAIFWNDPGSGGGVSSLLKEFGEKHKVPDGHGFHLHNYFSTIKLRITGSNRWVTIVDKGRSTSLDNPEVRVLASRYGDPDEILATEWVPEMPGINVPGDYEAYAQDAYEYNKAVMEKVKAGTYGSYRPDVRSPGKE